MPVSPVSLRGTAVAARNPIMRRLVFHDYMIPQNLLYMFASYSTCHTLNWDNKVHILVIFTVT